MSLSEVRMPEAVVPVSVCLVSLIPRPQVVEHMPDF